MTKAEIKSLIARLTHENTTEKEEAEILNAIVDAIPEVGGYLDATLDSTIGGASSVDDVCSIMGVSMEQLKDLASGKYLGVRTLQDEHPTIWGVAYSYYVDNENFGLIFGAAADSASYAEIWAINGDVTTAYTEY